MKKLKLMNHMGTGGLQSFKVNVRQSSLISCRRMHFFMRRRDSELIMVNVYLLERLCGSELIFYRYMYLKTYAKFTFCIKSQGQVFDENFLYYYMNLANKISSYGV